MTSKLRVAQVGVGGFGAYRRKCLRKTGLFDLAAAYDWNPEALSQCQREEGTQSCASYEELLAVPGLEAVIISTGAKFHAAQIIQAAEKGLHVFVEKPLCSTPEDLQAILAAQKRTGVKIGVGHHDHTQDAHSLTIKRKIESGELGRIAAFEYTTAHSGGFLIKPSDWRGDPQSNPGGMLFQCGVHGFHELMFYFGPVAEVFCMMRYDLHTTATADVAICQLRFASGLIGTLHAYHVTPYRHTLSIFGTQSNLYREDLAFDEGMKLFQQTTHLDGKKEPRVPFAIAGTTDACSNLRHFHSAIRCRRDVHVALPAGKSGEPCEALGRDACPALRGAASTCATLASNDSEPCPSLMDGARAVQVVFAAEESARTGRPVAVPRL